MDRQDPYAEGGSGVNPYLEFKHGIKEGPLGTRDLGFRGGKKNELIALDAQSSSSGAQLTLGARKEPVHPWQSTFTAGSSCT